MAGEIDFRALSPGLDYGQLINSFGAGQQARAQKTQADIQAKQLTRLDAADLRDEAKRTALAGAIRPDGSIDYEAVKAAEIGSGNVEGAIKIDSEAAKSKAAQIDQALKEQGAIGQLIGSVTDQASYDAARARAGAMGLKVDGLPPQYSPETITGLRTQSLSVEEQLKAEQARVNAELAASKFGEDKRSNMAREGLTMRGQDRASADAAAGRANSRGNALISAGGSGMGKPPSGYRYTANGDLEGIPGGPALKDKALTEGQAKGTGLYRAASEAAKVMNTVRLPNLSLVTQALDGNNVSATGLSQDERRVLNAQRAFANATLRLESGAAISQGEVNEKARVLFPAPGDGPQVLKDKAALRSASLAALRDAAGPGASGLPRVTASPQRQRQTPISVAGGSLSSAKGGIREWKP